MCEEESSSSESSSAGCPPQCSPCCDSCSCCPTNCCEPCTSFCIFDLETAVFDTRHLYQRACRDVVASYDKELPDDVLFCCGTMETQEMAELVCRKCNLPTQWENFLTQLNDHTCRLITTPPLMDGVERLVKHLYENCVGLALITSSPRGLYKKKICGREKFFDMFRVVLCADEYNRPKPEPDCYLIAMRLLCEEPCTDCFLAFDGSVKGVQAAHDAHLKVIMVPDPDLPCCWSELATQRLDSLSDFDPEEYDLPKLPPPPPPQRHRPPQRPRPRRSRRPAKTPRNTRAFTHVEEEEEEEIVTSGVDNEEPNPDDPAVV